MDVGRMKRHKFIWPSASCEANKSVVVTMARNLGGIEETWKKIKSAKLWMDLHIINK